MSEMTDTLHGAESCLRSARRHLGGLRAAVRRGAPAKDVSSRARVVRFCLRGVRSHLRRFRILQARELVHGGAR